MLIGRRLLQINTVLTAGVLALCLPSFSFAEESKLQECAAKYVIAKDKNELAGKSWQDFYASCQAPATESKKSYSAAKPEEIIKVCATTFQETKAANGLNGQSWQDFYKVCSQAIAEASPSSAPETKDLKEPLSAAPQSPDAPSGQTPTSSTVAPIEDKASSLSDTAPPKEIKPVSSVKKKPASAAKQKKVAPIKAE